MSETLLPPVQMARKCQDLLQKHGGPCLPVPPSLNPLHLKRMCEQIESLVNAGKVKKAHRWIGFIQAGLLALGILDLTGLQEMFDDLKLDVADRDSDLENLLDHLDPDSAFEFELGGEG